MRVEGAFDYRSFLRRLLDQRIERNPRYSLRAFSHQAQVSPSHLSRVLSGQKKLSLNMALKLGDNLKLSTQEKDYFLMLVELEAERKEERRSLLLDKIKRLKPRVENKILTIDAFRVLSDWYHFAILSLAKNKIFKGDAKWISKKLGIRPFEARMAFERLTELELLRQKDDGSWTPEHNARISTPDDLSSLAIRNNHRQNMKLALLSLEKDSPDEREFNNFSLSFKKDDLGKAKTILREALQKISDELETEEGDSVYQLNMQFFEVTQAEE